MDNVLCVMVHLTQDHYCYNHLEMGKPPHETSLYACCSINHAVAFTVLTSLEAAHILKIRGTTPYPAYQDQ